MSDREVSRGDPNRNLGRLTKEAKRPRADGAPAPPASGPVEREVRPTHFPSVPFATHFRALNCNLDTLNIG